MVLALPRNGSARDAPPPHPPSSEAESAIIPDLNAVRESVFLLPGRGPAEGVSWPGDSPDETLAPAQVAAAKAASFPRWQKYEDEFISFHYPRSPHISLRVQEAGDTFSIMGGAVSDCENTFVRNYRLMMGGITYCAMMLDRKVQFDDGICLCGAVVYNKYLFRGGALHRFSFLEDGAIKKIQMLRGGMRVVLFEWTHLPIHQEMYFKLALGVALKGEPLDEPTTKQMVREQYGFAGGIGFLVKGMSRYRIKALLGAPAEDTRSLLIYRDVSDDRYETTLRLPLMRGGFDGFKEGWRSTRRLPPARGSVAWIAEKTTESFGSDLLSDYDLGPVTADDARFIFEKFLVLASEAEANDWNNLCRALSSLFDKGYKDDRVVPVVRGRYLDIDLRQHWAEHVLARYDAEGSQNLFVRRAKLVLGTLARPDRADWYPDDLSNLLAHIGRDNPEREAIVLACMDHENGRVKRDGYFRCGGLPPEHVLPRIISGLSDDDDHIRFLSAVAFRDDYGDGSHVSLLRRRLESEREKEKKAGGVERVLQAAIKRLSE